MARNARGDRPRAIELSRADRDALRQQAEASDAPLAARAQIVLAAAAGCSRAEIARQVAVSRPTVAKWLRRFAESGVAGLATITEGRGRPPSIPADTVRRILETPHREQPPDGKPRWTVRAMAQHAGVSPATVQRLWRAHGITRSGTSTEVPGAEPTPRPSAAPAGARHAREGAMLDGCAAPQSPGGPARRAEDGVGPV